MDGKRNTTKLQCKKDGTNGTDDSDVGAAEAGVNNQRAQRTAKGNDDESDDAVNTKDVLEEVRCVTEERQEGKDARNGTGDVTVNRPIGDVNSQQVSTKPMSQGVGKGQEKVI